MAKSQRRPRTQASRPSAPAHAPPPVPPPILAGVVHQQVQQGSIETRAYASPFMAPDDLERFNQLVPGGAERFLRLMEEEQAHRHQMEDERLETERRGQWFALCVLLAGIVGAVIVVLTGHDYRVALALVGLPITAVAVAFITGTVSGKNERIERTRILARQPGQSPNQQ